MLKQKLEKISYSNISTFMSCPHQWQKYYLQKLKIKKGSIDLVFGTAMHEAIQDYLKWYYETPGSTVKLTEEKQAIINKYVMHFINKLQENIVLQQNEDAKFIVFEQQVEQYAKFGLEILTQFIPNTSKFFKKKDTQLYGIQVQLYQDMQWSQIKFCGYLDIVLYNTKNNTYKIIDLKTARYGWGDRQKNDISKRLQLQLYKYFFSRKLNVPMKNIELEFLILKKHLYESQYKLSRMQKYQPPSGETTINKSVNMVKDIMQNMQKISSGQLESQKIVSSACDWCPFSSRNQTYHCDKGRKMKIKTNVENI